MTTYAPDQFRKILKAEQAQYIEQAIELARVGNPTYEGSLHPTGSVEFFHRTIAEGMEHWGQLVQDGWTLIHEIPMFADKKFSFCARKPNHVFELDKVHIAQLAEKAYLKEVEDHNKQAKKLQERQAFIEQEFERREEERKAQLRVELAREYDNRGRVQRVNSTDVQLHAR